MRLKSLILAMTGCAGLAAACAHAQSAPVDTLDAPPLCALSLEDGPHGRALVASAAPGLSGSWTLQAGGPAMMLEQSGDLTGRPDAAAELARLQLVSSAGRAPGLEDLRPGQTVIGGSAGAEPVSARLEVSDVAGRLVCEAQWG